MMACKSSKSPSYFSTSWSNTRSLHHRFTRYRVAGYSVRLKFNLLGRDVWHYTFELHRENGQMSMEKAMCHPAADEMDDWNEYQSEAENNKRKEATRQEWDSLPLTSIVAARESVDSGYASRRASEQLVAEGASRRASEQLVVESHTSQIHL